MIRRAVWLLSACALRVCALDPTTPPHQLSHRTWTDRDGLPRNTIIAITQTTDGYLWAGTDEGLARFDGVRFTVYDSHNTPELRVPVITAIAASHDGSLWAGTRGGGLIRHYAGRFQRFGREHGLPDNIVRTVLEDRAGRLWIGTQHGLVLREGEAFRPFGGNALLPSPVVLTLLQDRAGVVWAGTSAGVARIEGELVTPFPMKVDRYPLPVRTIEQDADGAIWAGTEGQGVFRLGDRGFERAGFGGVMAKGIIRALRRDRDGILWTGGNATGLLRLNRTEGSQEGGVPALADSIVRCLFEDSERNLWVGTEGAGLHRLSDPRILTYTMRDGLSHNFARAILEDRSGAIWIGTEGGGLSRYRQGKFDAFSTRDGLGSDTITALLEDKHGAVWVAAEDGGLSRYQAGVLRPVRVEGLRTIRSIWSMAEAAEGGLWLATGGGVHRIDEDRVVAKLKLPWDHPRALLRTSKGELWIGFREGTLAVYRNGSLTPYERLPGMIGSAVSSILEDRSGRIWVATASGLMLFHDGTFFPFTRKQGLFHDKLFDLLDDGSGNLWLTSTRGIFAAPMAEFLDVAAGRRAAVRVEAFTTADGLRTNECSADSQPGAWRARDGSLWFATVHGVAVLNPQRYRSRDLPVPVHLEGVRAGGRELPLDRLAELPAGTDELVFRYTAPHFLAPEKLRFQYRLEGLEPVWQDAGERREVTLRVNQAGNYRFQVRLADYGTLTNSAAASYSFSVAPHFYKTSWFYAVLLIGAGGLAYMVHRHHLGEVRTRFNAVLAERSRVAREIHDTLIQGFTGAALELDAITRGLTGVPERTKERLGEALENIDACLTEARQSIVQLRHRPMDARDLPSAVADLTRRLAAGSRTQVQFETFGRSRPVPETVEQNLLAVLREALSNSLRYSGAALIRVELSFSSEDLRLRIRDDGCGLPAGGLKAEGVEHFGLIGMQERAAIVGGRISFQSEAGTGAEVMLEVPLPQ